MRLKQSIQVSMTTLRAATTWHGHSERVSGNTYHSIYLLSPMEGKEAREQKHSTDTNGT